MYLYDLFSEDEFEQMREEGMITVRPHDGHPLFVANYSDQAQYKNVWNDVTLNCRGLIFDEHMKIIARPWKKFFNMGDSKAPWINFDDRVEVTDKMDGSLGIMYDANGTMPSIATRGSFHSTQASWATKKLRQMYKNDEFTMYRTDGLTFLFEIIYPTNRIVVDYGQFEGLVLLGGRENNSGYVFGPDTAAAYLEWQGLTTEVMPFRSINDVLAADDRANTEGYVIRQGNHMIKWKRPDYIELHRLISNLSEKSVWSGLEGGKTVEELIEGLPDEFHGFVTKTANKLLFDFHVRKNDIRTLFIGKRLLASAMMPLGASDRERKKHFAQVIKDHKDKAYYFALYDGKDIDAMIWQELKPSGDSVSDDPRL